MLTRRASEGSEALPSLARRVRMSFFGARVMEKLATCPSWLKRQSGCLNSAFLNISQHFSTFLSILRLICSVHGYPARRAASTADPDNSLIPQRWVGAPDFSSEWAGTGLTSLKRKRRLFENTYRSMRFKRVARKYISFNALRLRFRLVARDFPGIVCILEGD